jgi:uncharacterized membrane protein YtjA (UPF0391 family)
MLHYAIVFFIIALVAGLFGFKNVETVATKISKIFFFIFLILTLIVTIGVVLGIGLFV